MRQRGFTVLELIVAIVFLVVAGTIFYMQKRDLDMQNRDSIRKTAINDIYYNLEDVYFPANSGYPEHLAADVLKGINPDQLKDPNGVAVGTQGSDYNYQPKDCDANGKCKSYTLSANLENEADYSKTSRNQ